MVSLCSFFGRSRISISVVANVDACRTEVEFSTKGGDLVAILYEDADGWHIERLRDIKVEVGQCLIEEAKARLGRYVNRTGAESPSGLTRGGLALWLMAKDDRTAMGLPIA